jgi:hypothetical protein
MADVIRLGFDLDTAIYTLHGEAVKAGAVPKEGESAGDPNAIATAHLHELQGPECSKRPCRLAGLCHALYELLQYRIERANMKTVLVAIEQTERMRKTVRLARKQYHSGLAALREENEERHRSERNRRLKTPGHDHDVLCVRPGLVLLAMDALLASAGSMEEGLRGLLWSPELQQPNDNRASDLLLTAVYQHLHWGGLTYREIAEFVPDNDRRRGAADRARSRVRSADARSLRPRELYRKAEEKAKVDQREGERTAAKNERAKKRRKLRSST